MKVLEKIIFPVGHPIAKAKQIKRKLKLGKKFPDPMMMTCQK